MQLVRSLAGTRLRSAPLRSVPLRLELARLPYILHYTTLDREHGALLRCESLRRSSIARSSFAPLLFARSFFARSSDAPSLFARRLHALYLATFPKYTEKQKLPLPPPAPRSRLSVHGPRWRSGRARPDSSPPPAPPAGGMELNKTLKMKQNTCRAPRPGRGGPRTPLAPRPRCSARACCAIRQVYDK